MKLTKKLFMSIMTLALVVVTLSASTFAWFTLGNEAKLEDVQVNVTTGTGMEISKTGESWSNKVRLDNPSTLNFTAVTSFDGINFFDTLDGALTGEKHAENVKYFEQVFYVRVTKNASDGAGFSGVSLIEVKGENEKDYTDTNNQWLADVSLGTGEGDLFVATEYDEVKSSDNTIVYGTKRTFDALNAVKVSFTPSTENATAKVYAYEDEDTAWGSVPAIVDVDHDNNSGTAAVKGINSGLSYDYAVAKDYDMTDAQPYSCNATAFPTYITDETITTATGTSATPEQKAAIYILTSADFVSASAASATDGILDGKTLDDHYMYAKVTVRIWLEGWDADCINAILAQKAVFSFQLKATE